MAAGDICRPIRTVLFALVIGVLHVPNAMSAPAPALYGITPPLGNKTYLVEVDRVNGQILRHQLFHLSTNTSISALAFHTPSGHFVAIQSTPSNNPPSKLLELDCASGSVVEHPIAGLPTGEGYVQGLEYLDSQNRLLITFSAPGAGAQRRIAELSLGGSVGACVTATLSPPDIDYLAETGDGRLFGYDPNDATRLFQVNDVCGSTTTTALVTSLPPNVNLSDPAFSDASDLFTMDVVTHTLYEVLPTQYLSRGDLQEPLAGLAFGPSQLVPVPGAGRMVIILGGVIMFAFGALVIFNRSERLRV